jgi:hypothetical protein
MTAGATFTFSTPLLFKVATPTTRVMAWTGFGDMLEEKEREEERVRERERNKIHDFWKLVTQQVTNKM